MEKRYYTDYSYYLGHDMTWHIHGSEGHTLFLLPDRDCRCWDAEDCGAVQALTPLIESGRLMLVCADGLSEKDCSPAEMAGRSGSVAMESYYHYICRELFVLARKQLSQIGERVGIAGVGLGAALAANAFFRKPQQFDGLIALSGVYESQALFGEYCDDLTFQNSPAAFLPCMPKEDPKRKLYNESLIYLCAGQGSGEQESLHQLDIMEAELQKQDIPFSADRWGWDVTRDWYWWSKQLAYFAEKLLSE